MLFGSDFPLIAPDRWIADFKAAAFKPEVHDLILKQNAIRALKRAGPGADLKVAEGSSPPAPRSRRQLSLAGRRLQAKTCGTTWGWSEMRRSPWPKQARRARSVSTT